MYLEKFVTVGVSEGWIEAFGEEGELALGEADGRAALHGDVVQSRIGLNEP